jgi:hypothetical protein
MTYWSATPGAAMPGSLPPGYLAGGSTPPPPPPSPLAVPTYDLQISFCDRWSAFPEWVNVTQWCENGRTVMGRQHELQLTEASQGIFTMDNRTGLFFGWNTESPFYNLIDLDTAGIDNLTVGTWTPNLNCTIAVDASAGYDSGGVLSLTAVASGDMDAITGSYPVTAGQFYTGMGAFSIGYGSVENVAVAFKWFNGSTPIGSPVYGATVLETGGFQKATVTAQAPVGATNVALIARVYGPNTGDTHFVDRTGITTRYTDISSGYTLDNTQWGPGQLGLAVDRTVWLQATWASVTYPIYYGFIESVVPQIPNEMGGNAKMKCTDALGILAKQELNDSAYVAAVENDLTSAGGGGGSYWQCNDAIGSRQLIDSNPATARTAPLFGYFALGSGGSLAYTTSTSIDLSNDQTGSALGGGGWAQLPGGCLPASLSAHAWSFECWINTSFTATQTLLCDSSGAGLIVQITGTITAAGSAGNITGLIPVDDGNWHHVVLTYDGTSTTTLYVDGVRDISSTAVTFTAGSYYLLGALLTPSFLGNTTFAAFAGTVDEVVAYHGALTLAQIQNHYTLGSVGFVNQFSGQMIQAFLEIAGVPSAFFSCATGISTVRSPVAPQTTSPGQPPAAITYKVLEMIQQITDTEQGFFFQDATGIIRFYDRHYPLTHPTSIAPQATFQNTPVGLPYLGADFQPAIDDLDLWNDVPVQRSSTASVNGVSQIVAQGAVFETTNPNSIQHFGRRTLAGYTAVLYVSDIDSLGLSQWLCYIYEWPFIRVRSITTSSVINNGSDLPYMLGLGPLEAIQVNYQPQAACSEFSQTSQIEQITHIFGPDQWDTMWRLAPFVNNDMWFTVDDPVRGVTDTPGILVAF